jgi:transposase
MLSFAAVRRLFLARGPQDMRRGIDTLSLVVREELHADPYRGDCFIFISRDRRKLKALIWEDGGFWLCLKRLEAGTFIDPGQWCEDGATSTSITAAQLHALLEGIDVRSARYRVRQGYRLGAGGEFVKSRHERAVGRGTAGTHRRRRSRRDTAPAGITGGSEAHDPGAAAAHPRGEVGARPDRPDR